MNNSIIRITVALVTCMVILLGIYFLLFRLVADRQLANIEDMPLYPQAKTIQTMETATSEPDYSRCQARSFTTSASEDLVQDFYKSTLISDKSLAKRDWVGDGIFFPETNNVHFYRESSQSMQRLQITTVSTVDATHVLLELCTHN